MEKRRKAVKYLRECKEITANTCSKLIKAEAAAKEFFLTMQAGTMKDKDKNELMNEVEEMKPVLDSLIDTVKDFQVLWLKGSQEIAVECRKDKGRRGKSAKLREHEKLGRFSAIFVQER